MLPAVQRSQPVHGGHDAIIGDSGQVPSLMP